jgi:hypothetical protein
MCCVGRYSSCQSLDIYFIGDTEGNNKWLGQYPGNREGVRCPYLDCKCQFHDLSNPNPNCIYLTMDNINLTKKRKQEDEDAGIEYYCSISMYDIRNALTEKSLPLSDKIHGPYKMMPPELLPALCTCLNHLEIRC